MDQATDRRVDQRRRTFASGTVILDNRMSTFDVVVRNRSRAGFLLKAENTALIPNEFSLRLPGEPGEYRCVVVRRSQNALGIKVIGFAEGNRTSSKPDRPVDPQADLRARLAERFPHLAKG
ncbi:MAG: hypothetical protein JJ908_11630 [Rhizobiales bacterium]|nr:hypothetical protein [Hyphomicrobiales bacterium]MBO6956883.1 hypothetical protein [Hyphomicrobiales bacterium]